MALENNYCRNPIETEVAQIWCFTTNPSVRLEYCEPIEINEKYSLKISTNQGFKQSIYLKGRTATSTALMQSSDYVTIDLVTCGREFITAINLGNTQYSMNQVFKKEEPTSYDRYFTILPDIYKYWFSITNSDDAKCLEHSYIWTTGSECDSKNIAPFQIIQAGNGDK